MQTLNGLSLFLDWLGRTSAQAGVLAVMILVVQALLRERLQPRWRHALWFLLIIRLALPWAPPARLSVYNLFEYFKREKPVVVAAVPMTTADSTPLPIALAQPKTAAVQSGLPSTNAESVIPGPDKVQSVSRPVSAKPVYLVAVWALGFIVFVGLALRQNHALSAAMRSRRPVTDQTIMDLLEHCKELMGIRCWLMVIETPEVKTPALLGFVRPKLIIPQGAIDDLGLERLRHVFLHELAHLQRRDILSNWMATLLLAVHWFNPIIWYAFHRMRSDQELACDHLALSSIKTEPKSYGRTIIHLLENFSEPARMPGLAGILEDQSQMKRRISMIAKFQAPSRKWSVFAATIMAMLACVALTNAAEKKLGGVDLSINGFTIHPYEAGGLYTVTVSIKNNGSEKIPGVDVYFFINDPEHKKPKTQAATEIAPGGTFHESAMPFALEEGTNTLEVVIDPNKKINQTAQAALKAIVKDGKLVQAQKPGALDIAITKLELQPYPEGGLYQLIIYDKNNSDQYVPKYNQRMLMDGKPIHGEGYQGGPYKPWETSSASSMPFAIKDGTHVFTAILDPENKLGEKDRTNNQASITVTIQGGKMSEQKKSSEVVPLKNADAVEVADELISNLRIPYYQLREQTFWLSIGPAYQFHDLVIKLENVDKSRSKTGIEANIHTRLVGRSAQIQEGDTGSVENYTYTICRVDPEHVPGHVLMQLRDNNPLLKTGDRYDGVEINVKLAASSIEVIAPSVDDARAIADMIRSMDVEHKTFLAKVIRIDTKTTSSQIDLLKELHLAGPLDGNVEQKLTQNELKKIDELENAGLIKLTGKSSTLMVREDRPAKGAAGNATEGYAYRLSLDADQDGNILIKQFKYEEQNATQKKMRVVTATIKSDEALLVNNPLYPNKYAVVSAKRVNTR